jgi:hypothetical protein
MARDWARRRMSCLLPGGTLPQSVSPRSEGSPGGSSGCQLDRSPWPHRLASREGGGRCAGCPCRMPWTSTCGAGSPRGSRPTRGWHCSSTACAGPACKRQVGVDGRLPLPGADACPFDPANVGLETPGEADGRGLGGAARLDLSRLAIPGARRATGRPSSRPSRAARPRWRAAARGGGCPLLELQRAEGAERAAALVSATHNPAATRRGVGRVNRRGGSDDGSQARSPLCGHGRHSWRSVEAERADQRVVL